MRVKDPMIRLPNYKFGRVIGRVIGQEQIFKFLKDCGEDLDNIIREIGRNLEGAIVEKGQD